MIRLPIALFIWVGITMVPLHAWNVCQNLGESHGRQFFCPEGNTCCPSDSPTLPPTCISGSQPYGDCCGNQLGCGPGYRCSSSINASISSTMCVRKDSNNTVHPLTPRHLPPYQLCSAYPDRPPPTFLTPQHGAAYLATHNLSSPLPSHIDTAWIVVHGSGHNADDYLCSAQQSSHVLVVAPWFLPATTTTSKHSHRLLPGLRWIEHGPIAHTWRYGANAVQSNVSSYAVIDELLDLVLLSSQQHQLQKIVIAGHSAGGQLVQRWALLTEKDDAPWRAVVANPKSFAWMDRRRWWNGTLQVPDPEAVALCPSFNEWEWGWERSDGRHREGGQPLVAPYVTEALATHGARAIVERYAKRDVVYLAGELDVLWNGDCEARMQGNCRLKRSEHFFWSLREVFGRQVHHRFVVSGVHHDHALMWQSPEGKMALFGNLSSVPGIPLPEIS